MRNLPVQSLNFDSIKENFKQFLKSDPNYKDFNFEGSGISTQLNILSYNTHYIGYFVKMLLDEAFVDSSHTKQALLSHAKRVGYIPKGMQAARATLRMKINTDTSSEPVSKNIIIERGTTFSAKNSLDDNRTYSILDGIVLSNRTVSGTDVQYVSDEFLVYEGSLRKYRFITDTSVVNQRFQIKDKNIDISTIRVSVKPDENSSSSFEYQLARDVVDIDSKDLVFYVTTDEHGYYQVFFGDNVFGQQPDNNSIIEVTYISTNGPEGDGAKEFSFNSPASGGPDTNIGNFEDYVIEVVSPAAGGLLPETVDDLKFSIPSHYRRQNRAFTVQDFRSILLSEFRNIDSINVWGGEDHSVKNYGKIYISIKPKFAQRLTSQAREEIKSRLIHRYGWVGMDPVFVDPEFLTVDVDIHAKIDQKKTNRSIQEIRNDLLERVNQYNEHELSRFDRYLSDVELINYIREGFEDYIPTAFSKKKIHKNVKHLHGSDSTNSTLFGNPIVPGTVKSSNLTYGSLYVHIRDDGKGKLKLFNGEVDMKIQAGEVDYSSGRIDFKIPKSAKASGYEASTIGLIEFAAIPSNPDIETNLNNIVQIGKVQVFAL